MIQNDTESGCAKYCAMCTCTDCPQRDLQCLQTDRSDGNAKKQREIIYLQVSELVKIK